MACGTLVHILAQGFVTGFRNRFFAKKNCPPLRSNSFTDLLIKSGKLFAIRMCLALSKRTHG